MAVMKMTDKKIATAPSLLYKGSRDTYAFPKMLECVAGKSGLLFALRDGDTHRFGCFIDGEIIPPDDPTKANQYKVPVFFFSLSGAYDAPTKIEMPEDSQWVNLAGTQGVVKDTEDEPLANVGIGGGAAALWLGFAVPGPAADLSSCQQWIKRQHLSDGYNGVINSNDNGTLAQDINFTCTEMEVWQVQSG
uniref:TLDc domain-containing protein n=1 Tax=Vitrella brassicaformis TaxID=1169539 RepID=A0A7S1JS07_9ALVE